MLKKIEQRKNCIAHMIHKLCSKYFIGAMKEKYIAKWKEDFASMHWENKKEKERIKDWVGTAGVWVQSVVEAEDLRNADSGSGSQELNNRVTQYLQRTRYI